jgi:hypothetical protein
MYMHEQSHVRMHIPVFVSMSVFYDSVCAPVSLYRLLCVCVCGKMCSIIRKNNIFSLKDLN